MRLKRGPASILAGGVVGMILCLSIGMAVAQPTSSSSTSSTSSTSSSTSTSTTIARTTTSERATTTSSSTSTSTTAAPASKGDEAGLSDTALVLVAAIVTLLVIILIIVLLMRRRAHDQWRDDARGATAEGRQFSQIVTRGLATLSQPAAAAQTWGEVDNLGVQLHSRLLGLMAKPPNPQLGGAVSSADRSLQTLRTAVESDRGLRVGPPPPTEAQLGYSEAQIRERVTEFNQSVDELSAHLTAR